MKELFTTYSLEEIIFFIIILAFAVKEFITFLDWGRERISKSRNAEYSRKQAKEDLEERLNKLEDTVNTLIKTQEAIQNEISLMTAAMDILKDSDRDDIKAWITEKHHYFCYEKGYIDDYNLDCIERRYRHYKDEDGNSFIDGFMEDIRNLPKISEIKK